MGTLNEDIARHEREEKEFEDKCPICEECGEHITWSDEYYDFDGTIICPECLQNYLDKNYRREVTEYFD